MSRDSVDAEVCNVNIWHTHYDIMFWMARREMSQNENVAMIAMQACYVFWLDANRHVTL